MHSDAAGWYTVNNIARSKKGENMIITTKTPNVLNDLSKVNLGTKLNDSIKACIYHNNEPVNILKAMYTLIKVNDLVKSDQCHPLHYELTLRYLSDITGYSVVELNDRVNYM